MWRLMQGKSDSHVYPVLPVIYIIRPIALYRIIIIIIIIMFTKG